MNPADHWEQVEELYHAALKLPAAERERLLQAAVPEIRAEVESLLAAAEQTGDFIDTPAYEAAAPALASALNQPQFPEEIVIGHFRLFRLLGKGGMGEVYLAQDLNLERQVALKFLPSEATANPDSLRRFTQEAKAASALNHPNIITIHEIGQVDGRHFIATEYIEGHTLRWRLAQGRLPLREAVEIATQTASALQAAHAAGIIHRDIKPENLMLRPDGYVKVLDFGLAKLAEKQLTQSDFDSEAPTVAAQDTAPGTVLGTVAYMSPEQARGQKVDARTDLWSLGVMLYEMLAGQRPFSNLSVAETYVAILGQPPVPLTQLRRDVPAELEQIVLRLLVKEREQRYPSAAELAAELKRLSHRLEIEAELADRSESPTLAVRAYPTTDQAAGREPQTVVAPGAAAHTVALGQSAAPTKPAPYLRPALALLLLVALAGFGAWWWLKPQSSATGTQPKNPAAERRFIYSLTVQKMRDGAAEGPPFPSSGRDFYGNGWKFRFNFSSPQAGYLYLINEGPHEKSAITYNLLFPRAAQRDGSALLQAKEALQTDPYEFDKNTGTENLWVIWAAQPLDKLEEIKATVFSRQTYVISEPQQRDFVRALLQNNGKAEEDRPKLETHVTGQGDVLIYLAELYHH